MYRESVDEWSLIRILNTKPIKNELLYLEEKIMKDVVDRK